MKFNEDFEVSPRQSSPNPSLSLFTPENIIVVYTVLSILIKMKDSLGMEAMLEYIGRYLSIIEKNNPKFKTAVKEALSLMSVEKIYKDALS